VKVDVAEVLKASTKPADRALYAKAFTGNDRITGGLGADKLYGRAGSDTFVFSSVSHSTGLPSGRDTVYDFHASQQDKIDLRGIDTNSKAGGNQALVFVGTKAFQGKAGEPRYENSTGSAYVHSDVDGDSKADFSVHLKGVTSVTKGDLYLRPAGAGDPVQPPLPCSFHA
jgi:serralysin